MTLLENPTEIQKGLIPLWRYKALHNRNYIAHRGVTEQAGEPVSVAGAYVSLPVRATLP